MIASGDRLNCEGVRPTTSCRKCVIDESNGKLDLLVKARQPTCSCDARGSRRLYMYVREMRDDSGEGARGRFAHRTTNAVCSPSALSAKTRESGPSGVRELGSVSQRLSVRSALHSMRNGGKTLGRFVRKCSRRTYLGLLCEWERGHAHGGHCQSYLLRTYGLRVRARCRSSPSKFVARGFCKVWRRQLGRSLRVKHSARSRFTTPISEITCRKNASSRETWWRTIYLAEKCVSQRFHLNPNLWS